MNAVLHRKKSVASPVLRFGSLVIAALIFLTAAPLPALANPDTPAGLPQIDPQDPRRFQMDGQPWYPSGYYPNIAALNGDQADFDQYYRELIDTLAANRINYLRAVFNMGQPYGDAMSLYERTGPGLAADGKPRFDLTRFNPNFFSYWRKVIEYARSRGIVVQLVITDSWHNKADVVNDNGPGKVWGMKFDYYHPANNINGLDAGNKDAWHSPSHPSFQYHQEVIRRVVDQLGDLPNLVYEISNENYVNADWERKLADFLTDYEASNGKPRHLVMPRDLPNHDGAGGKRMDAQAAHKELAARWDKSQPLIADNDGGGDADPAGRRKKAWAALTAGGHISYFHGGLARLDVLRSPDAQEGMAYIGLVQKFLTDFNVQLKGMQPKDGLVSNGWALARPGERYIIYLINGGSTQVSKLSSSYRATWFNPRDGSSHPASEMRTSGGPTFKTPDGKDWLLYIEADLSKSLPAGLENTFFLPHLRAR